MRRASQTVPQNLNPCKDHKQGRKVGRDAVELEVPINISRSTLQRTEGLTGSTWDSSGNSVLPDQSAGAKCQRGFAAVPVSWSHKYSLWGSELLAEEPRECAISREGKPGTCRNEPGAGQRANVNASS